VIYLTPQSKLDWVIETVKHAPETHGAVRQRLRGARARGNKTAKSVVLPSRDCGDDVELVPQYVKNEVLQH